MSIKRDILMVGDTFNIPTYLGGNKFGLGYCIGFDW
jgi:hypothetical protein